MNEAVEPTVSPDPWNGDVNSTELAQLREALKATPEQRLAMLEELIELARRAGASPRPSVALPASPSGI
jgi:hypothetical protein